MDAELDDSKRITPKNRRLMQPLVSTLAIFTVMFLIPQSFHHDVSIIHKNNDRRAHSAEVKAAIWRDRFRTVVRVM